MSSSRIFSNERPQTSLAYNKKTLNEDNNHSIPKILKNTKEKQKKEKINIFIVRPRYDDSDLEL